MSWHGHYLDGQSAQRRRATIHVGATGLEIITEDGVARRWPLSQIRQTQGVYAGEPVRLERGGAVPEVLIVPDVAFLTALRAAGPRGRGRFHNPRWRRLRLPLTLAAGLAAIGLVVVFHRWIIPAGAGVATQFVPVAWEVRLGDEVFTRLASSEQRCQNADRQAAIDTILTRLTDAAGVSPYRMRVAVVDWPDVNALALPGGQIVVLRGLLDVTDSPEMLAGVLAHEVQHVLKRHTTRAIIQHASTGLMVGAVAGDVSGIVTFALEGARLVGTLNYSRRAEEEADAEGMRLLLRARVDPAGMIAFFDRVLRPIERGDPAGMWRYLSTHPPSRERVEALRALARTAIQPSVKLLPDRDWKDVKRICAG